MGGLFLTRLWELQVQCNEDKWMSLKLTGAWPTLPLWFRTSTLWHFWGDK